MGQWKILIKFILHEVIKTKKIFHYKELGQGGEHYVLQHKMVSAALVQKD